MDALLDGLDHWRRCEVDGCSWQVREPRRRCTDHGGPIGPEYWESESGEILMTRHMNLELEDDDA